MTPFSLTCARRAAILAAIFLTAAPSRAQHQPRDTGTSSGTAEPRTGSGDSGGSATPAAPADTAEPKPKKTPDAPAAGTAVPRTQPPPEKKRPDIVVVPDGSGDYGYGGYDGGYYDPYDPERSYPDPRHGAARVYEEGTLRLKVQPRAAAVYIDGYYTGVVDDFDGFFQRLRIEAGPHRIELQDPKYETLTVNVRVDPNRTTVYRGKMKKLP